MDSLKKKVWTVVCVVKSKPVILNWIQLLTPHPVIKLSDKNLASPDVRPSGPIDFCELVKETSTKGSILQLSEPSGYLAAPVALASI